jgi:calcineurin-like phosphoesterase
MCGPHDSIIGRAPEEVIRFMTTGMHSAFQVGTGGEALCAAIVTADVATGLAQSIKAVRYPADHSSAPFA